MILYKPLNFKQTIPRQKIGEWDSTTIAVYCYIKSLHSCTNSLFDRDIAIDGHGLCYMIYGDLNTRRRLNSINKSLSILEAEGVIKKTGNYYSYIEPKSKESYITITMGELNYIIRAGQKNLLFYFLKLIDSLNGKIKPSNRVGFMPRSYFAKMLGVSEKTIDRYNAMLEEAGLIYIERSCHKNNIYGRACDKEIIKNYAKGVN